MSAFIVTVAVCVAVLLAVAFLLLLFVVRWLGAILDSRRRFERHVSAAVLCLKRSAQPSSDAGEAGRENAHCFRDDA